MTKLILPSFFFLVFFVISKGTAVCPEPETTTTPAPPTTTPEPDSGNAQEDVEEGNVAYTGEFLYQLRKKNPETSFVASPFSVLIPLGQLAYFSEGKTYDQIMAVLNLKTKSEILKAFPPLIENYQAQKSVTLELASKYYSSDYYPLSDNFMNITRKYFASDGASLNFADPVQAAATINKWVEEKTHDKIKNLVSPQMFNSDTRLALVNAIYFLGNWKRQFNPNDTETKDFYVSKTKTIQVPMMYQKSTFGYAESADLNAKVLELPYKGDNFSCIMVLPNEIDGLTSVIDKLRLPGAYYNMTKGITKVPVHVYAPRFEIETTTNLGDMFKLTNLGELLNPNSNDISGILKNFEPLHVSAAVQKAFFKLNEVGTEAAAANTIIITTLSLPLPPPNIYTFNANHPFLFFIKLHDEIIFCGVFAQ